MVLLHGSLQVTYFLESLTQFLLGLLQLSRQLSCIQVAAGGCLSQAVQLLGQLLDSAVSLGDCLLFTLDRKIPLLDVFLKLLNLRLQLLHLALQRHNLLVALSSNFIYLNLGICLLDFLGLLDRRPQFLLCLCD